MTDYKLKIQISLLILLAALASGAALAASASAIEPLTGLQWLFNGEEVKTSLNVETEIELLLEDKISGAKVAAKCSMIQVESVGANGGGEVKEILNLSKEAISLTALSGLSLSCVNTENCESPKVWIVNLPWPTYLGNEEILEKESLFTVADLKGSGGNPGWYAECTILGIKVTDECTSEVLDAEAKNVTGGVEAVFSTSHLEELELPLATCSQSKEAIGAIEGKGTLKTVEAGTLSISTLGGSPQIDPSEYPIDFGTIKFNETLELEFTLANLGPGGWIPGRTSIRMGVASFLILTNTCTAEILESMHCSMKLEFAPVAGARGYEGELFVGSLEILMEGVAN